jgi:hypothetical protein
VAVLHRRRAWFRTVSVDHQRHCVTTPQPISNTYPAVPVAKSRLSSACQIGKATGEEQDQHFKQDAVWTNLTGCSPARKTQGWHQPNRHPKGYPTPMVRDQHGPGGQRNRGKLGARQMIRQRRPPLNAEQRISVVPKATLSARDRWYLT